MHPSRAQKAAKILAILRDFLVEQPKTLRVLDVGCSDGAISQEIAPFFSFFLGSDIDQPAIHRAAASQGNHLAYFVADGSQMALSSECVDVVICAQVYEHAARQQQLADEIWRVLRPGGVCFFSGPNRLAVMEEHYWLPFLSWLPQSLANAYMRWMKKGTEYDIKPMYYWQIRQLWQRFEQQDYNLKIIKNPEKFAMQSTFGYSAQFLRHLPLPLLRMLSIFIPNYNWILVKHQ